jgi:serine protease Do
MRDWNHMRKLKISRRISSASIILLSSLLLQSCGTWMTPSIPERKAVEDAIRKVKPALVRIHVVSTYHSEGRELKRQASGSGVIISPKGHVVTNHHVAGDAVRIWVTMSNREEIPAKLIGTDPLSDIAVIQLVLEKSVSFPVADWGDSDLLRVGDKVLAMGSPLALAQSVTEGVISNTTMTLPRGRGNLELDGENVGSIVRWIQHDALILPGNSGGPLISLEGQIIGINEIGIGGLISAAIPGNLARGSCDTIIENGEINRAWLGIMIQPLFKGDRSKQGVIISDVIKDSPAAQAGLQPGDRLLSIGQLSADGAGKRNIHVRFAEEIPPLNLWITSLPIGEKVELEYERDGAVQNVTLTTVKRERVLHLNREYKPWGLTGRDLSIWTAIEKKRLDTKGVLVTSVRTGGPCGQAKPSIHANDIILSVEGKPVQNMDSLSEITNDLVGGRGEIVPLLVRYVRKDEEMMTVVKVGLKDPPDPGREVRKAWIPVATQVITRDIRDKLNVGEISGVRVTQVYDDSRFKLMVGDLIVSLNGEDIQASETHHNEVFATMLREYSSGNQLELGVIRDGKPLTVSGKLPRSPAKPREMKRYKDHDFDFSVRNMAYLDRVGKQLEEDQKGVLIESVTNGSWSSLGGLRVGDVLIEINGEPVTGSKMVREMMKSIRENRLQYIIMKVRRGVHIRFVEIEALWPEK